MEVTTLQFSLTLPLKNSWDWIFPSQTDTHPLTPPSYAQKPPCFYRSLSTIENTNIYIFKLTFFNLFKISFFQNVPPALLLRFLREHRSEWADNNVDAYAASAVKLGPCSLPGSTRLGSFGGQVILPLAHTIEHEEASRSISSSSWLHVNFRVKF